MILANLVRSSSLKNDVRVDLSEVISPPIEGNKDVNVNDVDNESYLNDSEYLKDDDKEMDFEEDVSSFIENEDE